MGNLGACPYIYTIDEALSEIREVYINENDYKRARNGMPISVENIHESDVQPFVRLKSLAGELFGIGRIESNKIAIERIFNI